MAAKLTPKQKRFVDEYLIDLNGTQAAIRAKYSAKTAKEQAARLLSKVNIQAEISNRQQAREKRTEITQDRVLRELASIGFADVLDFAEVGAGNIVTIRPTADIPKEKRAAIAGVKEGANGVEVKLADKLRALEMIGKHLGMFGGETRPPVDLPNDGLFDALNQRAREAFAGEEDVPEGADL